MNKKLLLLVLLFSGLNAVTAQTLFWSDTFEDSGAPSSGTRTPSVSFSCGGPPATAYFMRTTTSGIALQSGTYSGYEGTKLFAAEDIDYGPGCTNVSISPNQQVTWTGISIAGKSGLSFKGLFAANASVGGNWEGSNFAPNQDFVAVEYSIDGGAWTKCLVFYAGSTAQTQTLSLETTGDLIGDSPSLSYAFAEFTGTIIGAGTTLSLRMNCSINGTGSEEIAVDNFRLFATPSCAAPVITANPVTTRNICSGATTTFGITATGATAYKWQVDTNASGSYSDLPNAAPYSGVTTNSLTITGATAGLTGYRYRAVAINGVSSCFTNSAYGTLNVSNMATTGSSTNATCSNSANGAASVTVSGGIGSYSYSWSPSGGSAAIASGLTAGNYTVTVTDAAGCTITRNYTIGAPPAINLTSGTQTNVNCFGTATGSASVAPSGGTPGYTYSWSPSGGNGATANNLAANTYTVTVTDAIGCSATRTFVITQPDLLTSTGSSVNVTCAGGNNGSATVNASGGTPGYTYSWSPSGGNGATASNLAANTYTCTITDSKGCQATRSFTITAPQALGVAPSQGNVNCFGGNNGTATVVVSGGSPGYTYDWTPGNPAGDGTASVSGLTAGNYSVLITDTHNCTFTQNFTITAPSALSMTAAAQTNVSCNGGNNGAASVNTPTGGTPGYSYDWTPGNPAGEGTTAVTGLTAGTYTCTVTDTKGCATSQVFVISEPNIVSLTTASQTNILCNGGTGAAAVNTATGGTPGYTYNWSPGNPPGDGTTAVTGLTAGTWTCTVTDSKGCTATRSFVITEPAALAVASALQNNINCNGSNTGSASVSITGGSGAYTYNWTPGNPSGDGTSAVSGLSAGTWLCTVTDANSCTISQSFTISQPAAITASASQTNVSCHGGNNGSAMVIASGGTGIYSYSWIPSGGNSATASGLAAGSYFCVITDTNGCNKFQPFLITEPVSTAWNGNSWTNGVPIAGTEAVINADYTVVSDLTACTLVVNGNATITVASGNDLNIAGPITVGASANLIIENNANLLQSGTGYANSGNVTVKRSAVMRRLDYVYWGAPVAGQDLKLFSPQTVSPPVGASRFFTLNEVTNGFEAIPEPSGINFAPAKGYMLRAPNDFPVNGSQATFAGVFKGVPNNGVTAITVTYSGSNKGFNMLGNPYPSVVSADLFLQQNPGELYFWTHAVQNAASGANYATYTTFGTASAVGGATPDGNIAVGQGFLLKTSVSGTATFTNEMRTGNNSALFFRDANIEKHRMWLNLSNEAGIQNQILVGYMEGATQGADVSIDARLIDEGTSNIASSIGGEKFSIQARALPFAATDEIPLSFTAIAAGNFMITADHFDGLFEGDQEVFIKDSATGITHSLKEGGYAFAAETGTVTDRFKVVFQNTGLGIDHPSPGAGSMVLYSQNGTLRINSGQTIIKDVKVFDMRGRLIFVQNDINACSTALTGLKAGQEVLLVQITSDKNEVITKKGVL